jgi:hypothetical protein
MKITIMKNFVLDVILEKLIGEEKRGVQVHPGHPIYCVVVIFC